VFDAKEKMMNKYVCKVVFGAGMVLCSVMFASCATSKKPVDSPVRRFALALQNSQYDEARAMVDAGFDCNENAFAFKLLFERTDLTSEQKVQIAKEVSNDTLVSPSILLNIKPEDYQAAIDGFRLDFETKMSFTGSLNKQIDVGTTILHIAAQRNDAALMGCLLKADIDVNALDENGHTALFYAVTVFGPSINWDSPITENEKTAKINFTSDMPFFSNASLVRQKQMAIIFALLEAGINVNQQNYAGWTASHFAAIAYPASFRTLLIEHGADPALKTNGGRTVDDVLQFHVSL
jgi:ankyrin repeat protein